MAWDWAVGAAGAVAEDDDEGEDEEDEVELIPGDLCTEEASALEIGSLCASFCWMAWRG